MTTSASLFTRYTAQSRETKGTRVSSKNRRREERKRARGKKGTVYEEDYLVNSIGRLITRVEDTRGDVGKLVCALMIIGKRFEAGEVQRVFAVLVETIRECMEEVFSEAVGGENERDNGNAPVSSGRTVLSYKALDIVPLTLAER